jgi:Tol biopolymer transport system component
LGAGQDIGELRALAWSPDGSRLALVGNTRGSGNLYLWDPAGDSDKLQPVLAQTDFGYLMGVSWSPDGQQLITWENDSNTAFYVVEANGSSVVRHALSLQLFESPRMAPNGRSVLFYGADRTTDGLFEVDLQTLQAQLISAGVEGENRFAWSPDGSRLAYIEMDRELGEERLVIESQSEKKTYASFPIPSGSGSALPAAGNLIWLPDGSALLFDMGTYASGRSVYLAHSEPAEIVQLVENGHAPAASADGHCLAFINGRQVFLMELDQPSAPSFWVNELPESQGPIDERLDQLQWRVK